VKPLVQCARIVKASAALNAFSGVEIESLQLVGCLWSIGLNWLRYRIAGNKFISTEQHVRLRVDSRLL
jgi:hypothetical protein